MAKSLQEQMLEMGLVNQKKAKKNAKEMKKTAHKRRTGDDADLEDTRAAAEAARKAKAEKDRELNRQREEAAQQKAITAQIRQLIQTNTIEADGDIKYNFVATNKKVKQLYVNQAVWDRLSRGQLAIIELEGETEMATETAAKPSVPPPPPIARSARPLPPRHTTKPPPPPPPRSSCARFAPRGATTHRAEG